METNYDKMADGGAKLFLRYNQDDMIRRWNLDADERYLYIPFFSAENTRAIDRKTGRVYEAFTDGDGKTAVLTQTGGVTGESMEAMILFDLLTYSETAPAAAGEWASVPELGGVIGAGHDNSLHSSMADAFTGRTRELESACVKAGGVREMSGRGDVSFRFRVFKNFEIWLQFWDADEDFPAAVRYLFDRNALRFMHYETLWYVMFALEKRLKDGAARQHI